MRNPSSISSMFNFRRYLYTIVAEQQRVNICLKASPACDWLVKECTIARICFCISFYRNQTEGIVLCGWHEHIKVSQAVDFKNYLHRPSHPVGQLNHWKVQARSDVLSVNPAQELTAWLHTWTSFPCDVLSPENRVHTSLLLLFLPLQTSQTAVPFSRRTRGTRFALAATTATTSAARASTSASAQVWMQVAVWHGRGGGDYQCL